ncbi:hypothetical protein [Brachybacterium vulturis]|uniref:hypothetical protein n=1 Tax=Brachybacterium vulturis TaxID=2017484 RepID=UPI0012FD2165|nr:hypothetical protein [Brachybacterium vulturis]
MLDVPYGTQVEGAAWHPAVMMHLYVGRTLPEHLAPYAPGPHTFGRFLANTLNPDVPTPVPEPADDLEPRQNQYEAADAIAERAAAGGRQFLLADEPGVGKTIPAIERYQQRTLALGHAAVRAADETAGGAGSAEDVPALLTAANTAIAEQIREATETLLGSVLFTVITRMTNRFSRSDG